MLFRLLLDFVLQFLGLPGSKALRPAAAVFELLRVGLSSKAYLEFSRCFALQLLIRHTLPDLSLIRRGLRAAAGPVSPRGAGSRQRRRREPPPSGVHGASLFLVLIVQKLESQAQLFLGTMCK